ncbi:MAG TPA: M1 family aminopeptidase, partial [Pyrinomonadaceae bacterium]
DVHYNLDLRTLADLYMPKREGFFWAFPGGGRYDKLAFVVDPLSRSDIAPEQVALYSFSETEGGIWTSFHLADDYKQGGDLNAQDHRVFDITRHEIDGTIRGTRLIAADRVTLTTLMPTRILPFELYRTLRVAHVKDDQGRELSFVQEGKDDDADFGVILPEPIETGKSIKLTIDYEGEDAIKDSGGGNFILIPRTSWYPNNGTQDFGDRAIVDLTFHYPKDYIFVGTGALAGPEQIEGDLKVAKWTSGSTELAVTGFNYGKFIKKELMDKETGMGLEFFANKEVPNEIKDLQLMLEELGRDKWHMTGVTGNITTASMADAALTDTQNATRIYSAYFGKLPYSRIAITQQPAFNFGQAWPTLIYMPYTAFIDTTQRTQLMGAQGGSDSFWRYVGPHETAHQWWGHILGWDSYRDQWMSEGFAEFSTSLFVQYVRKDMAKFNDFWDNQRKLITEATPFTKGHKPYTVGPVTQGYRLDSGKTPNITRAMIYPKGAYILHMLRMMMFD